MLCKKWEIYRTRNFLYWTFLPRFEYWKYIWKARIIKINLFWEIKNDYKLTKNACKKIPIPQIPINQ